MSPTGCSKFARGPTILEVLVIAEYQEEEQ
jgi:hypothetical protein